MSTTCYHCKSKLKWHVRDDTAEIAKVQQAVNAFLAGFGSGTTLTGGPPNITYFCAKDWGARMGMDENAVATGAAPPAQTLAADQGGLKCAGVAFASTHKAFMKEGTGDQDIGRISFVYCHELMHWYSHNHVGFQGLGKGVWGINWDEMTTDYIAANVFPNLRKGDNFTDLTFYNNDFVKFPALLARGFVVASGATGWRKKNWDAAMDNVAALNHPESVALATALSSEDIRNVSRIWLKWYFTDAARLKPFLDCFDALKSSIIANEIKTLKEETEDQACCPKGYKRPTW